MTVVPAQAAAPFRQIVRPDAFNDMRPSRVLPPLEACLGTRPSHVAKSRPRRKLFIGGAKASMASAVTGPTPGMV